MSNIGPKRVYVCNGMTCNQWGYTGLWLGYIGLRYGPDLVIAKIHKKTLENGSLRDERKREENWGNLISL